MIFKALIWAICVIFIGFSFVEFNDYREQKQEHDKEFGKHTDDSDVKFGHPWAGIIFCIIGVIGIIYTLMY